jgi:hypothetical protein
MSCNKRSFLDAGKNPDLFSQNQIEGCLKREKESQQKIEALKVIKPYHNIFRISNHSFTNLFRVNL